MTICPEELAELITVPVEAAQLILDLPPNMSEQELRSRLQDLVLPKEQRSWIWEIHKNCDQLIHQRLASFTAAQAMTSRVVQPFNRRPIQCFQYGLVASRAFRRRPSVGHPLRNFSWLLSVGL